jgi:hypothetical protein
MKEWLTWTGWFCADRVLPACTLNVKASIGTQLLFMHSALVPHGACLLIGIVAPRKVDLGTHTGYVPAIHQVPKKWILVFIHAHSESLVFNVVCSQHLIL